MSTFTLSWNDLTINTTTNLYLYGQLDNPVDLQDEALIRQPEVLEKELALTTITLTDITSFMTNGPGRYANGVQSSLVNLFMNGVLMPSNGERQERLVESFDLPLMDKERFFSISQVEYDPNSADFNTRAYVFGHENFAIATDAKFIVEADGTRYIDNYVILPGQDNFDYVTSWALNLFDDFFLEDKIDPSGIGRRVDMTYDQASKDAYKTSVLNGSDSRYTHSDYLHDLEKNDRLWNPAEGIATFTTNSYGLTQDLFDDGVTKFLDADNKPILYGSDGDDTIFGTLSRTKVDIAPFITSYGISGYAQNGIHYIGGDGNDTLVGTDYGDKLFGGDDNDFLDGLSGNDALDGGKGNDNILGEDGNDTLNGGEGNDTLQGGTGKDTYIINSNDGFDTILDTDHLGSVINRLC